MRRYVTSTAADGVHLISEGDDRRLIATVKAPKELALKMAAADDLYAACEKALNYIANTESDWGITIDSGQALRAALARARGEQPLASLPAERGK